MMRPVFLSEEDYKKHWQSSIFWVEKDYRKEYEKHREAMRHIAEFAKTYILENYEKVEDWSLLDIKLRHNLTGETTEFYNHYKPELPKPEPSEKMKRFLALVSKDKPKRSDVFEKMRSEYEEKQKAKHNPIVTFDRAVLDTHDGDFSVTINGEDFYWIDDEPIIKIADYIEEQLAKN